MIRRVFDLPLLLESIKGSVFADKVEDFKTWFEMPHNIMLVEGKNVGLATFEYPGVYSVHWFFKARGREAINLGRAMLKHLFDNYDAKIARGLIRVDLKPGRWAARQVGYKSHGIMKFEDGTENEVFTITKADILAKEISCANRRCACKKEIENG
jgi:hypothetical protein